MKELLEQAVVAASQPEYGLFAVTEGTGLMFPNPTAEAIPQGLALLEFVGECRGRRRRAGRLAQRHATVRGCNQSGCDHCSRTGPAGCMGVAAGVGVGSCSSRHTASMQKPNTRAAAGMLVGKALYEGILLNLSFAPFFLRSLQVRACTHAQAHGAHTAVLARAVEGCGASSSTAALSRCPCAAAAAGCAPWVG